MAASRCLRPWDTSLLRIFGRSAFLIVRPSVCLTTQKFLLAGACHRRGLLKLFGWYVFVRAWKEAVDRKQLTITLVCLNM